MLLDERPLVGSFECRAAAESIHDIVEQLTARRGPETFIGIDSAVPRNHFPLRTVAARHAFRSCTRLARAERAAVPSIFRFEREDYLRRTPCLLDRLAAFAAVQG